MSVAYTKPAVEVLGSLHELTLTGNGKSGSCYDGNNQVNNIGNRSDQSDGQCNGYNYKG